MPDADRPRVGLLSLEPWDDVWRRNQHLATRLVADGTIGSLVFVAPPPAGGALRAVRSAPTAGVEVVVPPLVVPRRYGGHRVLAAWLRRTLADVDVLWVNDPVAGAPLLDGRPAVYDVTDDWRSAPQPAADRARIVAAEDVLAAHATTVVCSAVLAARWRERYGVDATLVHNGVDTAALHAATPVTLTGSAPHAVYVGTVHANRIDVDLVVALAAAPGTVHLVGPDGLDATDRQRLDAAGVRRHGPVPSAEVPDWLVAADVLICPHLVDDFTLSLDAIKSYEYLATDRPVVATPSSGFQTLALDGLSVVGADGFVPAVARAATLAPVHRDLSLDWADRAAEFGAVLRGVR